MQNGDLISKILLELRTIDVNWENLFLEKEKRNSQTISKQINQLLRLLRQELKTADPQTVQTFLLTENVQEQAAAKLVQTTTSGLRCYYDFALFRELEHKNATAVTGLLTLLYQKYVVRFEPGYLGHMAVKSGYEEDRLDMIARWTDYLTDYYISRSYTLPAMIRDLLDETGLSQENCEYWANLIEQNYTNLKMNYIIEKLDWVKDNLKDDR